jgi:hypothetical protein
MSASVAGVVRDSAGTPQIGVAVELLRADATVVASAYTDRRGFYSFTSLLPGQYALKAMSASYIPTLKQNLRLRANTVVNLTLNTLYDLMQWAPQPHRARLQGEDDWAWTLRSAESRPLLRWQDDGSPVLVSDGSAETHRGAQSKRRLRVLAQAGERRFGASPNLVSIAGQQQVSDRRRVAMSAEASPGTAGLIDAMLGFRQEMAQSPLGSSSVQTLAALMQDPEVEGAGGKGFTAVSLRSWETLQLLNSLEAEAGSDQVLAHQGEGNQVFAALPFASLTLHRGAGGHESAIEYRVATAHSAESEDGEEMASPWLPILSERDGELVLEHGLHQELGWTQSAGPADLQLIIYGDSIENPLLEGAGHLSAASAGPWLLVDQASGMVRAAGPSYSATGMLASFESRLPGGNRVKLSYASGDALVMHAAAAPESVSTILQGAHAHRAQMYALALSGTVEKTGTRWRASYRWQPESTVTEVAPFAVNASEPYLNVYIRQPIWADHDGPASVEAQVDARNLLAEGYQPFITEDGTRLYFAQAQRAVRGGLAFTF